MKEEEEGKKEKSAKKSDKKGAKLVAAGAGRTLAKSRRCPIRFPCGRPPAYLYHHCTEGVL